MQIAAQVVILELERNAAFFRYSIEVAENRYGLTRCLDVFADAVLSVLDEFRVGEFALEVLLLFVGKCRRSRVSNRIDTSYGYGSVLLEWQCVPFRTGAFEFGLGKITFEFIQTDRASRACCFIENRDIPIGSVCASSQSGCEVYDLETVIAEKNILIAKYTASLVEMLIRTSDRFAFL